MTRACIIGVSGFGDAHYEMLLKEHAEGNVDIVGATIINQDEEALKCSHLRSLGCRIFEDCDAMFRELAGVADLCLIPTGTPLHMPMTVAALEAGMHVLVEKPAAGCIQDVRTMQKASSAAGKLVALGYQYMYEPLALETKRSILDKAIGNVEAIKCRVMWPRDHAYYSRNNWAGQLRVGDTWVLDSPFNNAVAHDLMMMLFLAGAEERQAARPISVKAELYRANDIASADTACIQIVTDTGVPLLFYATHACSELLNPEIHVRGSRGNILWTHDDVTIESDVGVKQKQTSKNMLALREHMMRAVCDVAQGGSSFYCDLETAAQQTIVVNAVHEACEVIRVSGQSLHGDDGSVRTVIPGIEAVLNRAFETDALFYESGVPWARPAGSLDCSNYRAFGKESPGG